MKSERPAAPAVHSGNPCEGARAYIAELEHALDRGVPPDDRHPAADVGGALTGLAGTVDQLAAEHEGMADELLAVYEQLGTVFEVTRQLPDVADEAQVLRFFRESLSRSFQHCRVALAREASVGPANPAGGRWTFEGAQLPDPVGLKGTLDRAKQERHVVVVPLADEDADRGQPAPDRSNGEVLAAPVFCGDEFVSSIVLSRPADSPGFRASDMQLIESLTTFSGDLIRNHRLLAELRGMSIAIVRSLVGAVDQKDPYTCGHSLRVAYYATRLGEQLGLDQSALRMLRWSALLHDVGKIGIRDDVLKKPGKLTPEEFDHIKEHPVRSYQVVRQIPQLAGALDGVLHHHERIDGSGYPSGLSGQNIPRQALIIQLADVFDALTSTRSYRPAFGWEKALDIMRQESGTVSDPDMWVVFENIMRGELEGDEGAWERMCERANRFTKEQQDPFAVLGDSWP